MKKSISILSLALLPFLTSCLDDKEGSIDPQPIAYVSFYHGAPDLSSLQIEVDNNPYNTNRFDYSTYFDYGRFRTGERNFSFKLGNAANSLLDTLITFEADKAYSFFISEEDGGFVPVIVEDEIESPGEGKALVRIVHLSPDAPEVNLQVGEEEPDMFENKAFRNVSDFVELTAGRIDLNLSKTADGESLVTAENIDIREGRIYTVVVRGYLDPSVNTDKRLSLQLVRNYPNY